MKHPALCLLIALGGALSAQAQSPQAIQPPAKYLDFDLQNRAPVEARFSNRLIHSGEFIKVKAQEWEACHRKKVDHRPFEATQDRLQVFLQEEVNFDTLEKIEAAQLMKSQLPETPWSGDYWAYASGILAARFQDDEFNSHYDWLGRYQYVQKNPASLMIEKKGQAAVDVLSPAEKYDLLTGAQQNEFTESQWAQGKAYYDQSGKVEGWMGICHGWAPAAIMEPRPAQSVDAKSLDGKWKLHFNPSEIKGLLSYSWATNDFPVVFLGERCNSKKPKHDKNGRLTEPECFDLNPATWHMAVVQRLGQDQKSFVMDATYDYEVWNQPVIGYSYTYFNPQTKKPVDTIKDATVHRDQYPEDPYWKYRSKDAMSLVGVEMKVGYVVESSSNSEEIDSPEHDLVRWVSYTYDLELNADGKIIGGEWYLDSHPDFIWSPKKGVKALSAMDQALKNIPWDNGESIPDPWAKAARMGAPQGAILNAIAEGLLNRSTVNSPNHQ